MATHAKRLGKYVNDSNLPNCVMKSIIVDGNLHLCLFALTDIEPDCEVRYNYGVPGLPWRKVCYFVMLLCNISSRKPNRKYKSNQNFIKLHYYLTDRADVFTGTICSSFCNVRKLSYM